jgi:hypothetical protein
MEMADQVFSVKNRRMEQPIGLIPASIKIHSKERASIVAVDYSVRIEHWNDPDYEVLSELFSLWAK